MVHGQKAPAPGRRGHLLCCDGIKGAWPNGDDPTAVLRLWPDASLERTVVRPVFALLFFPSKLMLLNTQGHRGE